MPILVAALLAAGCEGGGTDLAASSGARDGFGLSPPAALLQSRAVDRSRLEPRVSIEGGPTIPMVRDGERWRGSIGVAPGRDYTLDILWVENVVSDERVRELPLARLRRTVSVGEDGARFAPDADEYDLALDFDGDGVSNLAERDANTDPFGDAPASGPSPADDGAPAPSDPDAPDGGPDPAGEDAGAPDGPDGTPDEPAATAPDADTPEAPVSEPTDAPPPGAEPVPDPGPPALEPDPSPAADVDVFIPRIAAEDAPDIDGRGVVAGEAGAVWGGEWANATSFDATGERLFVDRLMIDRGIEERDGQAFRAWSAMHDGKYLYVLVVVEDDGQRVRDSEFVWEDDSLELYVDGDNSKRSEYGDADDASRLLPLLAPGTTRQGVTEGVFAPRASAEVPIVVDFATGPGLGPDGLRRPQVGQDVYELRIALESAGIRPGRPFGFELQVNDDDDGGGRDAKWGWAHPARTDGDVDFTYLDPSFMGTAVLE